MSTKKAMRRRLQTETSSKESYCEGMTARFDQSSGLEKQSQRPHINYDTNDSVRIQQDRRHSEQKTIFLTRYPLIGHVIGRGS
jgi:hypothetical protein